MPTNVDSRARPVDRPQFGPSSFSIPPNWEPQPLSQMRQASFLVKGKSGAVADISLVRLGPAAGNVLDNVNRWLDQLGKPPISDATLSKIAERLKTQIGEVSIVDLAGLPKDADPAKDGRIIAAMISSGPLTFFFKMRGNAELVESQKAEFVKWVAEVCNSQMETAAGPAGETAAQNSSNPQIKWKTPEGWTEVPATSMRYASFAVSGPNGEKIDISIVTFPGDGGGDPDNVNRWRGQIGLAPIDAAHVGSSIVPLKTANASFSTIDMAGADSRVIAAWARHNGRSWFIKMTGPNAAVEKEKSNFVKFIESIRF